MEPNTVLYHQEYYVKYLNIYLYQCIYFINCCPECLSKMYFGSRLKILSFLKQEKPSKSKYYSFDMPSLRTRAIYYPLQTFSSFRRSAVMFDVIITESDRYRYSILFFFPIFHCSNVFFSKEQQNMCDPTH